MFCERLRVRLLRNYRETDTTVECVKTGNVFEKYRVMHTSSAGVYVNYRDVRGFDLSDFVREALDRYSYVSDFVERATTAVSRREPAATSAVTPYSSADFDKVLNVCQSMGQWAWGYCAILDLLGVTSLNAANVVWDGFPHLSRCGVWHDGRVLWLGGAARQVLEYWFIVHGGYHSPHEQYVSDRENYERACHSIASPWSVADVQRSHKALEASWLVAARPANRVQPEDGDFACDGVLYRPSAEGKLLPLAYAAGDAPACDRTGWLLEDRNVLLARMGVPLQLRQEILYGQT
jgi:hypothetical protein